MNASGSAPQTSDGQIEVDQVVLFNAAVWPLGPDANPYDQGDGFYK
jgi:hypothetical protein